MRLIKEISLLLSRVLSCCEYSSYNFFVLLILLYFCGRAYFIIRDQGLSLFRGVFEEESTGKCIFPHAV